MYGVKEFIADLSKPYEVKQQPAEWNVPTAMFPFAVGHAAPDHVLEVHNED